jgi:hypothetical protein
MRCACRCTRRRANRSARVPDMEEQPGPAGAARVCSAVEGNHGKTLANPPLTVYLCHSLGWSKFWVEMKCTELSPSGGNYAPLPTHEDWQEVYSYRALLRRTTTKTPKKKKAAKNMKVGGIMILSLRSDGFKYNGFSYGTIPRRA